ncbi:MAG: hypothetical protein ACK2US_12780 [Anaerolineae bacterium]|jgi:hypothetical protein
MTKPDIRQRAAERLLEDESLTADLIDDAAKLLLEWGLKMAEMTIQQAKGLSLEEIDARLAELRRTMRRINHEVGQIEPEAQAERLGALLSEPSIEEEEPEVEECCANHQDQQPSSQY